MKRGFMAGLVVDVVMGLVTAPAALTDLVQLEFDPEAQAVSVGSSVDVDIVIANLGDGVAPSVGAFDFEILFDDSILAFDTLTFGDPVLGDQIDLSGFLFYDAFLTGPGVLDVYEISLDLEQDLNDLQAEKFVIATLTFDAIGLGDSDLTLIQDELVDAAGNALPAFAESGSITVIPAPGAALLGLIGLGLIGARGRQGH